MTPIVDLTRRSGPGPVRSQRPVYVDLLPPCNVGCPAEHFLAAIPATAQAIAVLEQAKEVGSTGEPLYLDVIATVAQGVGTGQRIVMPRVIGGRYGLSSKDFTPAMAKAALDELCQVDAVGRFAGLNSFTLGINDDPVA